MPSVARCSPSVCSLSLTDSSPASGGALLGDVQTLTLSLPHRGRWILRSKRRRELKKKVALLGIVNPSVGFADSSPAGEPFSLPPTKSCPRLRGKCRGVAVTKGEWLKLPSNFTIPPQLRLRSAAPPFHGGAFLLRLTAPPPSSSKTPRPGRKAGCAACRCGGI